MPLTDITNVHRVHVITPKSVEKFDLIKAFKRRAPATTFARVIKTVDEALDALVEQGSAKFVWTKMGALLGHGSNRPKCNVDHLWEKVIEAVGDGKECLMLVGSLLRWRISIRDENWVLVVQQTDEYDYEGDKWITVSTYWIPTPRQPGQEDD